MKDYVVDQLTLPVFSLLIILVAISCFDSVSFIVIALIMLFLSCILCYRVLLLPLDLICGKCEADVQFSRQFVFMPYHTDPKLNICIWRFYKSKKKLDLVNPYLKKRDEIVSSCTPPGNQTIKIYYYKYSKIFCSWEDRTADGLS